MPTSSVRYPDHQRAIEFLTRRSAGRTLQRLSLGAHVQSRQCTRTAAGELDSLDLLSGLAVALCRLDRVTACADPSSQENAGFGPAHTSGVGLSACSGYGRIPFTRPTPSSENTDN